MSEVIIALLGVLSVVLASVLTFMATRSKNTSDTQQGAAGLALEERRDTLSDRDSLIAILQGSVDTMQAEMKEYRVEVGVLRVEVGEVRTHNNALVTFVYKMLAVFRKYDLEHEIPDPKPEGIEW